LSQPHGPFLPALGQALPVVVDLVLGLAFDLEGDGLVERELGAAVDADESLAVQLELHGHHRAGRSRTGLRVVSDVDDARVLEDSGVEARGLLGLGVETTGSG
jgi:hypothetical protein